VQFHTPAKRILASIGAKVRVAVFNTGTMAEFWSLRGLSWRELAKRTLRKSWEDEVFGQSARLAFYLFFATFPVLLLLVILLGRSTGVGSELLGVLFDSSNQVLPPDASSLVANTTRQLNVRAVLGTGALLAGVGAAWGVLNGTWAIISGLNKAYEVEEERSWRRVSSTVLGSWGACSDRGSRASHVLGGHRDPARPVIRRAIPFWAELKRSEVAMEHPRRCCRG